HPLYYSTFAFFLLFNSTAPTPIYTLSLHDALPIYMDNKDFWYGLLAAAQQRDAKIGDLLSMWIHEVGSNELKFNDAMRLLRSYRSEEHTSELQSLRHLVCRLLLEKKKKKINKEYK